MSQQKEKWHLSKSVSLSHILTTITMAACFVAYLNSIDDRIDENKYRLDSVERAIEAEHEYVKEAFDQIREDLNYIRDRLDKIKDAQRK